MAGRWQGTTVVDRPIEEVFRFLADGQNDRKFSPRVQEIRKATDGPPGIGTVYASTVKDAGLTTQREFEITEFVPPTRIRWAERSKNLVTVPTGGYDLEPDTAGRTRLVMWNELDGHGAGKLLAPLALRSARKGAGDFVGAVKRAVEAGGA
jgi:polyketide cyclase/dehydrase/lipid transport protein